MINENINISKVSKYLEENIKSFNISDNVFLSMPKTVLEDFVVIQVMRIQDDMSMGYAYAYVKLFAKNIGRFKVENTEKLEDMEDKLMNMIKTNCITEEFSLSFVRYWSGAYYIQDVDMDICGRLYEIKININNLD